MVARRRAAAPDPHAYVDYSKDIGDVPIPELIAAAKRAGAFVFDLETTGLNPLEDRIEGIAFFVPKTKDQPHPVRAWYPFVPSTYLCYTEAGDLLDLRPALDQRATMEALRPLFEDPALIGAGHNLKFDLGFLQFASGTDEPVTAACRIADSMIADYLSDERRRRYGLKVRVKEVFGVDMVTYAEAVRGWSALPFMNARPLGSYAMEDCMWTWELFQVSMNSIRKQMPAKHQTPVSPTEVEVGRPLGRLEAIYWGLSMKVTRVLMEMEATGVLIDWRHLEKVEERLNKRRAEIASRVEDYLGWPLNLSSPQQVADAFFAPPPDGLGLPTTGIPIGSSGHPSTGDKIVKHFKRFHPLVQDVLELRSIDTVLRGFVVKIKLLAQESPDGRVRSKFNQTGTVIGRLSSSDPFNAQNQPRDKDLVRAAFCASLPDDKEPEEELLGGDYGQVELRVLSHLAKEENMREVYRIGKVCTVNNGGPCDRFTFHECKLCDACVAPVMKDGKPTCGKCGSTKVKHQERCRHVDLHQRTAEDAKVKRNPLAKNANFGLAYRMAAPKFCVYADLFDADGRPMIEMAQEIIDRWMAAYPGVPVFHDLVDQRLPLEGWVAKTIFGRPRRLNKEAQINRFRAVTQGIQFEVSGSAQDFIQRAMVMIAAERDRKIANSRPAERKKWEAWRLLLQVHDELLFKVPRVIKHEAGEIFKRCMETADGGLLSVPLVCDIRFGRTWDDAH